MRAPAHRRPVCFVPLLLILTWGCTTDSSQDRPPVPPAPKPEVSNPVLHGALRVRNVGSEAIVGLVVRFPEDSVVFGDVHPGETTEYQDVPHGVFRYGALAYTRDGRAMHQGVVDVTSEAPHRGKFTYELRFAPIELGRDLIRNLLTIANVIQED